ncbi:hypothetical protein B0H13DRAFT_1546757, partial [Mycena leptocephala]
PQMITWLDRREKIASFSAYRGWLESSRKPPQPPVVRTFTGQVIQLGKKLQSPRQPLADIELHHYTDSFIYTMKEFLNNITPVSTRMPFNRLQDASLPFTRLDIYRNFNFEPSALDPGVEQDETSPENSQTVTIAPLAPPRFDAVIVRRDPNAEATGLSGTRFGHVKVLFRLPEKLDDNTPAPTNWPTTCLAYVEWFSTYKSRHDDNHEMYSISALPRHANGTSNSSIIPLTDICQT